MDPQKLQTMMAQAQQMAQRLQEEMKTKTAEGQSGGGMVTATVSGEGTLVKLKIDPRAVDPRDVSMLEDLVVAAVHDAHTRVKDMVGQEMRKLTGGMGLPPLF
jgi:DNA-binding YbaB/EbfC family protein